MPAFAPSEITQVLSDLCRGDKSAESRLFDLIYPELRRQAGRAMSKEYRGHTLQPTALVNEVYIKLLGRENAWQSRAHFLGVAGIAMRQILADHARRRLSFKRGGGAPVVELQESMAASTPDRETMLDLDGALTQLSDWEPQLAKVAVYRLFGGLTEPEIAAVLEVSTKTVQRDWNCARNWLKHRLNAARRTA